MFVRYTLEVVLSSTALEEDAEILHEALRSNVVELRAALQLLKSQTTGHVLPMPEITFTRQGDDGYTEYDIDQLAQEIADE